MSMNLSVYVGPYLEVVDESFVWDEFENIVTNGRMEAGTDDPTLILIPNTAVPGIDRQTIFERCSDCPIVSLWPGDITVEQVRFRNFADQIVKACKNQKITVALRWGIVPCWD